MTPSNATSFRLLWSFFVAELLYRRWYYIMDRPLSHIHDKPIMIGNKTYSPDFVINEDGKNTILEFKAFRHKPSTDDIKNLITETADKYLPAGDVILVISLADDRFPTKIGCKTEEISLYTRILGIMDKYAATRKGLQEMSTNKIRSKEVITSVDDLIKYAEFKPWISDFPAVVPGYSEVKNFVWRQMPRMHQFIVPQLMEPENLPDVTMRRPPTHNKVISTPAGEMIQPVPSYNIWSEIGCGRDANKSARNQDGRPDLDGGIPNVDTYGHSSTQLLPYLCNFRDKDHLKVEELIGVGLPEREDAAFRLWLFYKKIYPKIQEANKNIATISSEYDKGIFDLLGKQYDFKTQDYLKAREAIRKYIKSVIKDYTESLPEGMEKLLAFWQMTSRGTLKATESDFLHDFHLGVGHQDKLPKEENPYGDKNEKDYGSMSDFTLERIFRILDHLNAPRIPYFRWETAYPFNPSTNEALKDLASDPEAVLRELLSLPGGKCVWSTFKFMRDIVMNVPIFGTKYAKTNEFKIFESNELGCVVLTSIHPNENTSGLIKVYQKVPKEVEDFLTKDNCLGVWKSIKPGMISSDWFRLNLQFVQQYDSVFGAYLGQHSLYYSLTGATLKSKLWESTFFNFTRQLVFSQECIYTLGMRGGADVLVGAKEGKDKFEKMEYKDLRVGRIAENIFKNWSTYVQAMREFKATGRLPKLPPFKDPFYEVECPNYPALLTFLYSKQLMPKKDGADEAKLLWGFFKLDCEQQSDWERNPFNSDFHNSINYTLSDFAAYLFKGVDSWVAASFSAEAIISTITQHYGEIKHKMKGGFMSRARNVRVMENVPSSRVNMPWVEGDPLVGDLKKERVSKKDKPTATKEEQSRKKRGFPGLVTIHLSEALIDGLRSYRDDDIKLAEILAGTKTFLQAFYDEEKDETTVEMPEVLKIRVTGKPQVSIPKIVLRKTGEPSLIELAIHDMFKYPNTVILTPVLKIQTGYGKRQFYVQTINGRNINSILDTGFKPILDASAYDLIQKPGDSKYVVIQRMIDRVKMADETRYFFVSSEDQSKFGDTYPLEAMAALFEGCYRVKFINIHERDFCLRALGAMHGRFHVMPKATQDLLDNYTTSLKVKEMAMSYSMRMVAEEILETMTIGLKVSRHIPNSKAFTEALNKNRGINKTVGFALGVMNTISTCLTVCHLKLVTDIVKDIHQDLAVEAGGHSDDSIKFARLPPITNTDVASWDFNSLDKLRSCQEKVIGWTTGRIRGVTEEGEEVIVDLKEVTVLFCLLSLYTPRLVGQRPSLFKWFFGSTGEVLQQVYTAHGVYVPLVRYTSALLKDMPGKSYATDMSAAISRVLPILSFGGTAECALMCAMVVNILVGWRFGMQRTEIVFDKHLVMWGGSIAIPTDWIEFGFDANLFRLLASSETNPILARAMKFLLMTKSVFKQRINTDVLDTNAATEQLISQGMEKENTNFAEVSMKEEDEMNDVLGDVFIDFMIRFNRYMSTVKMFGVQFKTLGHIVEHAGLSEEYKKSIASFDQVEEDVESEIQDVNKLSAKNLNMKNVRFILKKAHEATVLFQYREETVADIMVRHLAKYTSRAFQEAYLKVPEMTKVINRLGYTKRTLMNPFNPEIFQKDDPRMTLEEVISTLDTIAAGTIPVPLENEQMFNFLLKMNTTPVSIMKARSFVLRSQKVGFLTQIEEIAKIPFRKVDRQPTMLSSPFVKEAVGLLVEEVAWLKPRNETLLMTLKPSLMYDDDFKTYYDHVKTSLLEGTKYTRLSPTALERNIPILNRILGSRVRPIYMPTNSSSRPNDITFVQDFVTWRWTLGKKMLLSNYMSAPVKIHISEQPVRSSVAAAGLVRALIQRSLFNVNKKVLTVNFERTMVECNLTYLFTEIIERVSRVTEVELSALLAILSLNDQRSEITFRASRYSEDKDKFARSFNRTVALFNRSRAETSIGEESERKKSEFGMNYLLDGEIRPLRGNTYSVIGVGFSKVAVVVYVVRGGKIVLVTSGGSLQKVRLYTALALLFGKEGKLRRLKLEDVLASSESEMAQIGDYTVNSEGIQGGRGDKLMYATSLRAVTEMINGIEDTVVVAQHKGFITLGTQDITTQTGEIETVPYTVVPWNVPRINEDLKVRFEGGFTLGNPLNTPRKLQRMKKINSNFSNGMAENHPGPDGILLLERILRRVILQSFAPADKVPYHQKVVDELVWVQIEKAFGIEATLEVREVVKPVQTLQGVKMQVERSNYFDNSTEKRVQRLLDFLFHYAKSGNYIDTAEEIIKAYEVNMTLWLVLMLVRVNLPLPMASNDGLKELDANKQFAGKKVKLISKMLEEKSFEGRLTFLLNQGIPKITYTIAEEGENAVRKYDDTAWVRWASSICQNCFEHVQEERFEADEDEPDGPPILVNKVTWKEQLRSLADWDPREGLPKIRDNIRLVKQKKFNLSSDFVDALLREFFMTPRVFSIAKNTSTHAAFGIWSGSYVARFWFGLWGPPNMIKKFGGLLKIF
jgi:hypothetical protein